MAKIIPTFESKRGRPPKHPWDKWCDGASRKLYRGTAEEVAAGTKDFDAELKSFQTMVHRKARELGPKVGANTHINKADQSINVQFFERS